MHVLCRTAAAAALATVICFAPAGSSRAEGFTAFHDDSPALMLFARKGFGASSDPATRPYLSFRVDKNVLPGPAGFDFSFREYRRLPLAEFRLTAGAGKSLYLSGVPMWDSTGSFGTEESWGNAWFWGGAALLFAGVSCAIDNWPCDDDDGGYRIPDEELPQDPGGE